MSDLKEKVKQNETLIAVLLAVVITFLGGFLIYLLIGFVSWLVGDPLNIINAKP